MDDAKYFKNRKWVIKAGIAFLVIMGLLTFFSNTIMNYSLPQVRAQNPTQGSISESIKGSGTVVANKQAKVVSSDTRLIDQVNVYLGQEVVQGDILATLVPIKESEELKQAQSDLDALLKSKEQDDLNNSLIEYDYSSYEDAIAAAQKNLTDANAALVSAQGKDAAVSTAKANVASAQAALDSLNVDLQNLNLDESLIQANISTYNDNLTQAKINFGDASPEAVSAQSMVDQEKAKLTAKETEIASKNTAIASAQTTLSNAQTKLSAAENLPAVADATSNVASAQKSLDAANKSLNDQKKRDGVAQTIASMSKEDRDKAITDAQKKVDDLTALAENTTITAPALGILSSLNISSGSDTSKDMVLATIDDKMAGFTVSIIVPNDQASQLQIGMSARDGSEWASPQDIAYISSIRIDNDNPTTNKKVILSLITSDGTDGNYFYYYSGLSLTLAMNNRSMQYQCMIPNSSIHEDGEGKFVYVLQQKTSPLGERYKAIRVGITVLATDGTNSAVDPSVLNNQSVITMSTKTLEDGKQVRLAYSQ